jgi:hypothetical protein
MSDAKTDPTMAPQPFTSYGAIEAMQYTGENAEAISEWAGWMIACLTAVGSMEISTPRGRELLHQDDWLVKARPGILGRNFYVCKSALFDALWRPSRAELNLRVVPGKRIEEVMSLRWRVGDGGNIHTMHGDEASEEDPILGTTGMLGLAVLVVEQHNRALAMERGDAALAESCASCHHPRGFHYRGRCHNPDPACYCVAFESATRE